MHTIDVEALAGAVEAQEPADAADTLEDLEEEEASDLLEEMDDQAAADALAEMQAPLAVGVLEDLLKDDRRYAARLMELMAPDDAADLLQALPDEARQALLAAMEHEPARELGHLSRYDPETAGGLMTTDFVSVRDTMTVAEAIDSIRSQDIDEGISEAPVIDEHDQLIGMIGFRRLLLAGSNELIGELMDREVDVIRPDLDREEVAHAFDRYDYSMLPVVDDSNRLLGVVTVDDVIDIIREEQTEDVQKSVGAGKGEAVYSPLSEKIRGRLPWLATSMILSCAAAAVILVGQAEVQKYVVLMFLLPVTAAVVGNAGHQALAVTLRGIVLDEVRKDRIWPLVVREGTVGLLNGVLLGVLVCLLVGLLSTIQHGASWRVGFVAGTAMAVSMGVGTIAGTAIPLLMRRFGVDPAQSSAIFLIMITDALSFASLISLAWILL